MMKYTIQVCSPVLHEVVLLGINGIDLLAHYLGGVVGEFVPNTSKVAAPHVNFLKALILNHCQYEKWD